MKLKSLKQNIQLKKISLIKKSLFLHRPPRENLKFMREYCETCGCIEIKYLHNYVKEKVHSKLGLNLQLATDEIVTAAKISVGKSSDYWIDIVHKGGDRIFDIENEIYHFCMIPKITAKSSINRLKKDFFHV